jgi:hypothetical protein
MVYVNTPIIQKLMAQPHWQGKFTPRDYAALTPADLGAREPVWPVRSRYELPVGSFVIEVAAGDTTVGSTPTAMAAERLEMPAKSGNRDQLARLAQDLRCEFDIAAEFLQSRVA